MKILSSSLFIFSGHYVELFPPSIGWSSFDGISLTLLSDEERIGAKRKKKLQHFNQFFDGGSGGGFGMYVCTDWRVAVGMLSDHLIRICRMNQLRHTSI